jgi:hypothetical protein
MVDSGPYSGLCMKRGDCVRVTIWRNVSCRAHGENQAMHTQLSLSKIGLRCRVLLQGPSSLSSPSFVLVEGMRRGKATPTALLPPEESLVPDARAGLTPRQMVDRRLLVLLGYVPGQ